MSAWSDCINDLQAAVGRKLRDSEIEAIAEAVQVRLAKAKAEGLSARAAAAKVGKEITAEQAMEAMIKRRDAANNILIYADARARMEPGNEHKSEIALLSGIASGKRNNANSIDATHHSLRATILGPAEVEASKTPGLLKAMQRNDRALNLDVARELYRRDNPDLPGTGNKMAVKAAEILGKVLDTGRAMQNQAGAFIGKIDGYMGRQYHDMFKVRGAGPEGNFAAWRDAIVPLLDRDKMAPGLTDERFGEALHDTWKGLATGVHDSGTGNEALSGFKGSANLGKKVSQGRSLIFKDADSWFKYNEQFGKGTVMDAIVAGADGAARATALMQKLGTNPEAMFQRIHTANIDAALARGDLKMVEKLTNNPNKGLLDVVTGKASIPGNQTAAQIGQNIRQLMQLKSLGGVIFSALSDIPNSVGTLRANGVPLFEALGHQIRAILPQGPEAREIAHSVGAGIDGWTGAAVNRFRSDDGVPGAMTRSVNTFHKFGSLLTPWTENLKEGLGTALSHQLARSAGKEFSALPQMMQVSLRRYGIEAGEWDVARSATLKAADGRHYILPGDIADPAVAQKVQTYIIDNIREGMNEPTARSRLYANFGTQAGTPAGEIVRSMMQFKSFTLTYMERHMGRMLFRDGIDVPGIVYLAVGATLAGYIGDQLYGLATNRMNDTPKDAAGWARVVSSAMARGGALGMLGDAILRDNSTTAGDVAISQLGPIATTIAQTVAAGHAITSNAKSVTGKSTASVAEKQGFNLLKAQVPNLIYTKAAYEYLFGHALSEMVNPGATQRYNNLLRQQGQHQVLRPALQN